MDIAIVVWKDDPAGMNVKDSILELFRDTGEEFHDHNVMAASFGGHDVRLFTIREQHIFYDGLDEEISLTGFKPGLMVYATTHRSSAGVKSLSVHTIGNFGKAQLGGKDKKLGRAPASWMRHFLHSLESEASHLRDEYDVVLEATHHGPYLEEKSWRDKRAGDVLAKAIVRALSTPLPEFRIGIGFGGGHYTPAFKKAMDRTDVAFGHICAKHSLADLDRGMIEQMISRTEGDVVIFALDYKGLGQEKAMVKELLESMGIEYVKTNGLA